MIKKTSARLAAAAALLVSSLGFSTPSLAAPGDPLGPAVELVRNASNQVIARAADGHFVVAYIDIASQSVRAQLFAADGTASGPAFQVSAVPDANSPNENLIPGSVAFDATNHFVIVWSEFSDGVSAVFGQRFDASGAPVGASFTAARSSGALLAGSVGAPTVAVNTAGDFVVAWIKSDNTNLTLSCLLPTKRYTSSIYVRRYRADGSTDRIGVGQIVDASRGGEFSSLQCIYNRNSGPSGGSGVPYGLGSSVLGAPTIAIADTGEFAVAWSYGSSSFYQPGSGGGTLSVHADIRLQHYSRLGVAQGAFESVFASPVSDANPPFALNPRMVLTATGTTVVWQSVDNGGSNGSRPQTLALMTRTYDATGAALALPATIAFRPLAGSSVFEDFVPQLSKAGTGSVLTWRSTDQVADNTYTQHINASRLDSSGLVASPVIEAANATHTVDPATFLSTGPSIGSPSVAGDAAGNFVLIWGATQENSSSRTFALDARLYSGQ